MPNLSHIDGGNPFDWGRVSSGYAKYRDIYPPLFYQKITELGLCIQGQDILDLGTGTGVLPRAMYSYGGRWTGADLSENQIQYAQKLAADAKMDIRFVVAPAEETGLPAASFDVITACQCIQYFDKPKLVQEAVRLLRPGGHFLILFMAWLPDESEIAARSESYVLRYNPAWTGGGLTRTPCGLPAWAEETFTCCHAAGYDVEIPFTRDSWHGRMLACRGIGASSLPEETIQAFEKDHLAYMQTLPEEFSILHYVTMLDLQMK